jgi:hypothetical protein
MKKIIVALVLLATCTAAFAHEQKAPAPQQTIYITEQSSNDDRGLVVASTAVADAVCNSIVRQHFDNAGSKVVCAVGVMAVAGLRRHPNLGAAAIGTGAGTLLSYAWKF